MLPLLFKQQSNYRKHNSIQHKRRPLVQQEGDVSCTNQAQGQGGQEDVPNADPTAITERGEPIPGVDVKLGGNPGGAGAAPGSETKSLLHKYYKR